MRKSVVFQNNGCQSVLLPRAVALPEDVKRVEVVAIGRTRIITPSDQAWDTWFDGEGVTDDYMEDRDQHAGQLRTTLDAP